MHLTTNITDEPQTLSTQTKILELDGIRGIAILFVLAVHFTPDVTMPSRALEWVKKALFAGWIGVDLFFVLSGFLITGILLRTKGTPHAFRNFFARRTLRIFPLYLAALTAVFVVMPIAMSKPFDQSFITLQHAQIWAWLHCTNVGAYFSPKNTFQAYPVGIFHLWSLSVEEHYYLIWPFVVMLIGTRHQLKAICIGIICFAFVVRVVAVVLLHQPSSFFYLTLCRIDALAAGSYLAVLFSESGESFGNVHRKWALIAGGISAISLVAFFFVAHGLWFSARFVEGPGLTLIGIMWGSLLVIVLSDDPASVLRNRICRDSRLRCIGTYSYGIYVIHGLLLVPLDRLFPLAPIAALLRGSIPLAAISIIVLKSGASLLCALVSWNLLERPALSLKRHFEVERTAEAKAVPEGIVPTMKTTATA